MTLKNMYQEFIHTSRYARWLDNEQRRESWSETVDRYVDFIDEHVESKTDFVIPRDVLQQIRTAIHDTNVFPSMRALMTAGPALQKDNVAGYNCSYLPIDDLRSFDELMYILMCGTGVGFSVESKYVNQLPVIPDTFQQGWAVTVDDSREGWATAFREHLEQLFSGYIPDAPNVDALRPAGARLKTFGGRSSGPQPLVDLFLFTTQLVVNAAGRRLTDIECHDLACKIGEIVVVGGVRRSALISLTDLNSEAMRTAKSGAWWEHNPHRALANISVAYEDRPTREDFNREWKALELSGSGERGIFNRAAARRQVAKNGRRDPNHDWGTNPCSEIILRPYQFCNLTTIVVREDDDIESMAKKVELATILGTFQSTLIDFKYLRPIWKQNTEEERLLGVSMTGQFGNRLFSGKDGLDTMSKVLEFLREHAVEVNKEWAGLLGIPQSAAVTCVKPEGTSSQLAGPVSSGMSKWYAKYYIRRVRQDMKDPLTQFMIDQGIPWEIDVMNSTVAVFSWPQEAPHNAIFRYELTAIEHLEIWQAYQDSWCEHKPSITVDIKPDEWDTVGEWVWDHFDKISGVAFLPYSEHTYKQAPFEEITENEYHAALDAMPYEIDWSVLREYEFEDTTTNQQTLACTAGACDVLDLVSQ